ncbi:hypothetical protein [Thalassotalea ganghwensis]
MNIDDKYILELGELTLRCKKVIENNWEALTFVFDVADGHLANSGFLYHEDNIRTATARIKEEPMLLSDKIKDLRKMIYEQTGHKFKQLLIQMEKSTGRIKIDFEFDNPNRWTIKPAKIKEMREQLRPDFS